MKKKQTLLFAIDVETSGCRPSVHNLLAIGICTMTINGNVITKKRISMVPEKIVYEGLCWETFWKDRLHIIEELKKDSVSLKEGLRQFIQIIDLCDDLYEVVILTDNPSFDLQWINYHLDVLMGRKPIAYVKGGTTYRPTFDTESYTRGLLQMDYEKSLWTDDKEVIKKFDIKIPNNVVHDHLSENDAHYICELHRQLFLK